MTRYPYINSGAFTTEDLVMDSPHDDTQLVRAGSSPTHQNDEELDWADLSAMDDDTQLVRAGSAPSDEEIDCAEPIAMDHQGDDGSSQTLQGDEELNRAEPMAMDHLDDDTRLVSAGSSPTNQSDEVLDRPLPRLHLELFASIFSSEPVQLKDFAIPPECYQYRDQASEILSQYLFHTDFNVKVWISFDAHEEVFFEGARSAACGKLQLPKHVYQELVSASPGIFKLQQVRLEVGTPFRTLATVDLIVERDDDRVKLRVRGKMLPEHADKRRLVDYIRYCCRRIGNYGLADGADGITFDDLQLFASLFRRDREASPGRDHDWEEPAYGGGEWAGAEDPNKVRRFTKFIWS